MQNIARTILTIVACFFIFFAMKQEIDFCRTNPTETVETLRVDKYWLLYKCGKDSNRLSGFISVDSLEEGKQFFDKLKLCGTNAWGADYTVQIIVYNNDGIVVKRFHNLNAPNPYIK